MLHREQDVRALYFTHRIRVYYLVPALGELRLAIPGFIATNLSEATVCSPRQAVVFFVTYDITNLAWMRYSTDLLETETGFFSQLILLHRCL